MELLQPQSQASVAPDFITLLRQELERRSQKNPRYSLRSFAKFLEIDSSALSKILNRKRPLGARSIRRFADKIGLAPQELAVYLGQESPLDSSLTARACQQVSNVLAAWPVSEEHFLWEVIPLARQLYQGMQQTADSGAGATRLTLLLEQAPELRQ